MFSLQDTTELLEELEQAREMWGDLLGEAIPTATTRHREKFAAYVWLDMTAKTCSLLPELIALSWPGARTVWN